MIPTMITNRRTITAPAAPSAAIMDCTVFAAASTAALATLKVFSPALAVFCIRRTPSEVCKAAFFAACFAALRSICFWIRTVKALELAARSLCSGWTLIFADWGAVLMLRFRMIFGSSCILGFSLIQMISGCFWQMAFCLAVSAAAFFRLCSRMENCFVSGISCPFWILGVSLAARIFCSFVLTASEIAFCRWAFWIWTSWFSRSLTFTWDAACSQLFCFGASRLAVSVPCVPSVSLAASFPVSFLLPTLVLIFS